MAKDGTYQLKISFTQGFKSSSTMAIFEDEIGLLSKIGVWQWCQTVSAFVELCALVWSQKFLAVFICVINLVDSSSLQVKNSLRTMVALFDVVVMFRVLCQFSKKVGCLVASDPFKVYLPFGAYFWWCGWLSGLYLCRFSKNGLCTF